MKRFTIFKPLCICMAIFLFLFPFQQIIIPENETEKSILNIKSEKGKKIKDF